MVFDRWRNVVKDGQFGSVAQAFFEFQYLLFFTNIEQKVRNCENTNRF